MATKKKIFAASGNECAFPDCDEEVVNIDEGTVIGEIAHIRARSENGPRYDPDMTDEERNSFTNLMVLCPTHHTRIDKMPDKYPPQKLKQWKQKHEEKTQSAPELSPDLLNKLIAETDPKYLLIYVEDESLKSLKKGLDWEPYETFPEKAQNGCYPVILTFDDLKELYGKLRAIIHRFGRERMNMSQANWTFEEIAKVTEAVSKISKSAIQYYQVEGDRRKSALFD